MLFEALDQISPVKIKVIVNGGIKSFADGDEMIAQGQSVAGTMIGVGLIDNPALLQWTVGPNGPVGQYQMTQSEYDGLQLFCRYWKEKEENWVESIKF